MPCRAEQKSEQPRDIRISENKKQKIVRQLASVLSFVWPCLNFLFVMQRTERAGRKEHHFLKRDFHCRNKRRTNFGNWEVVLERKSCDTVPVDGNFSFVNIRRDCE